MRKATSVSVESQRGEGTGLAHVTQDRQRWQDLRTGVPWGAITCLVTLFLKRVVQNVLLRSPASEFLEDVCKNGHSQVPP